MMRDSLDELIDEVLFMLEVTKDNVVNNKIDP